MDPEISALVAMLKETILLFRKHSIEHWASWLEKDVRLIQRLDFYGIEHLLSAYGGMGSLNDVAITEADPENAGISRVHTDNIRVHVLISEIYSVANKLAREESR